MIAATFPELSCSGIEIYRIKFTIYSTRTRIYVRDLEIERVGIPGDRAAQTAQLQWMVGMTLCSPIVLSWLFHNK